MLIVLYNIDSLAVQCPWPGISVVPHVYSRAGDNYFCLICIEVELVAVSIVTHDVEGALETAGRVGEQVGVIGDTDGSGADVAELEAEVGAVQAEETGVDVHLEMAASPDMPLSISLVLLYPPA